MDHEEFARLRKAGELSVDVAAAAHFRRIDRPVGRSLAAHNRWTWAMFVSIPVGGVLAVFVAWWLGLLLLLCVTPALYYAMNRAAAACVVEEAEVDRDLFETLVREGLVSVRAPRT